MTLRVLILSLSGERRYATLPAHTEAAVPAGAKRIVAATCPSDDDPCRLVVRTVSYGKATR